MYVREVACKRASTVHSCRKIRRFSRISPLAQIPARSRGEGLPRMHKVVCAHAPLRRLEAMRCFPIPHPTHVGCLQSRCLFPKPCPPRAASCKHIPRLARLACRGLLCEALRRIFPPKRIAPPKAACKRASTVHSCRKIRRFLRISPLAQIPARSRGEGLPCMHKVVCAHAPPLSLWKPRFSRCLSIPHLIHLGCLQSRCLFQKPCPPRAASCKHIPRFLHDRFAGSACPVPHMPCSPPGSLCLLRRIGEGFRQRAIPRRDCQKPFRGARIPLRRQKAEPRPPRVQAVAQNAPRPLGRQFRRRRPQRVPDRARRRTQKVPSVLSAARVPIRRKPDRRPARVCQHPKPARPDAPFLPSLLPRPRRLFALFARPAAPKHVRPSSLHPWFLLVPFSPPMRRLAPAPRGMPAVWLTAPARLRRLFLVKFSWSISVPPRSCRSLILPAVSVACRAARPLAPAHALRANHHCAFASIAFSFPAKPAQCPFLTPSIPCAHPAFSRFSPPGKIFRLQAPATCCTPHLPPPTSCRPLSLPPASCRPLSLPPASCHSSSLPPDASSALFPSAHCIFHSAPCRLPYPLRPPSLILYTPCPKLPDALRLRKPPRLPAPCPLPRAALCKRLLPSPFSLVFSLGKEHSPARAPC